VQFCVQLGAGKPTGALLLINVFILMHLQSDWQSSH